jgi:hypothetical protein
MNPMGCGNAFALGLRFTHGRVVQVQRNNYFSCLKALFLRVKAAESVKSSPKRPDP